MASRRQLLLAFSLAACATLILAQSSEDDGLGFDDSHMDHSDSGSDSMDGMDMGGSSSSGQHGMNMFFHCNPTGDTLWFSGWAPSKAGPMAATCIGLFMLAVFERWVAACRAVAERSWARSAQITLSNQLNTQKNQLPTSASSTTSSPSPDPKSSPAFPSNSKTEPSTLSMLPTLPVLQRSTSPAFSVSASAVRQTPPFILSNDASRAVIHGTQTFLGFMFMLVVMTFQVVFILALVVGAGVGEMLFGRYATSM